MSTTGHFDHPITKDLYKILADIEELETMLKEAREQLHQEVTNLPTKIGDNKDLNDAVFHHFYWFDERVPANALKQAFQRWPASQTRKANSESAIKNARIEIACSQCTSPFYVEFESRHSLNQFRGWHSAGICEDCKAKASLKTNEEYAKWRSEREERVRLLHAMPYYEYLKTAEWAERRLKAMKRARFRCQVCNAYGVRLNVHHRTYERRGFEYDQDLITLCETCHGIFHENGQLAEEGVL